MITTLNDGEAEALKTLAKQCMLNNQKIGALIEDNVALDWGFSRSDIGRQDDYEMWLAALEKVQKETEKIMRKQQFKDLGGDKGENERQSEVKLKTGQRK